MHASKITPCLWYDHNGEEAANSTSTLSPTAGSTMSSRSPADNPSMKEGGVLVVEFTLAGQPYIGLNGGPQFHVHRGGLLPGPDRGPGGDRPAVGRAHRRWRRGEPVRLVQGPLGPFLADHAERLLELMADPDRDRARRAMEAMMKMKKIDIAEVERAADGVTEPAD